MTKLRSPSKQRILDVAFEHFVLNGYEGASLAAIAETVGIRKASIYTHFKSKDALFLELLQDALEIECEYLKNCFGTNVQGKLSGKFYLSGEHYLPGEFYLGEVKSRYENAVTAKFLTRIAYVPPSHLIEQVTTTYQSYLEQLIKLYQIELFEKVCTANDRQLYTDAYLGILDSLSVELLYDGRMYERRLHAMLYLYKQSMQMNKR